MTENKGNEIPQSAKNAARAKFLKKKNKRKATKATEKKQSTEKVINPRSLKKAKKIK